MNGQNIYNEPATLTAELQEAAFEYLLLNPGSAKMVQGSRLGVALFLFRATFSFSPSRPLIGEA